MMILPPGSRAIVPDLLAPRGVVLGHLSSRGYHVALDVGPVVWSKTASHPPLDGYERAISDPALFYEEVFERYLSERSAILRAVGGEDRRASVVKDGLVAIPHASMRHFAIARRLLFPASLAICGELVQECEDMIGALALLVIEASPILDRVSDEVASRLREVLHQAPGSSAGSFVLRALESDVATVREHALEM
jgi:hypothetical protein